MISKRQLYVIFIICIAAVSGVLYGYDLGIITAALLVIPNDIPMTPAMMGFAGGSVLAGGAVTILLAGPIAELIGRKKLIFLSSVIFIVGVGFLALADSYLDIVLGRLIQGVAVGIITIVVPMYLVEILPGNIRGRGMSTFQWFLKFGVFFASLIGLAFTNSGNWHMMFVTSGIPGIILFATCFFLPESPRWLLKRGRKNEALNILKKICTNEEAQSIINSFGTAGNEVKVTFTKSLKLLFKRDYIKPVFIVLSVAVLNQLIGNNSLVPYSGILLKKAGLGSNFSSMIGSSTMTSLGIIFTFVCMLLIDRIGRKKVLCSGLILVFFSLAVSGITFLVIPFGALRGWLVLIGLLVFEAGYSVGPGVIVWLVISELLPNSIRSVGMSLALFLNSLASALLATTFFSLTTYIDVYGVYWLCALFALAYLMIAMFMLPETTNKTLEEIEEEFKSKKSRTT
jgi:MFS transporter, SP family, galactose:H+ symporter